jgi:hypothetical protein
METEAFMCTYSEQKGEGAYTAITLSGREMGHRSKMLKVEEAFAAL